MTLTCYISSTAESNVTRTINSAFAGAITSSNLSDKVNSILSKNGYSKETTLLATAFCSDEACRDLEKDLCSKIGPNFQMGGLAGFPSGGITAFRAMASHIPTDGSCIIVYGPHVGVALDGTVGRVNRRGVEGLSTAASVCCGSANAAMAHVLSVRRGEVKATEKITNLLNIQQSLVEMCLLEHGDRLEKAENSQVEVGLALFDSQANFISDIVKNASGVVAGEGKIALLGGVQINTPGGFEEYYLPKQFLLLDNKGEVLDDLLPQLLD